MDNVPPKPIAEAKPSATVVLMREVGGELEVLMLQKTKAINYGGSWVFPGGVFDPQDYVQSELLFGDQSTENVARVAACRETQEEAGLDIAPDTLSAFSHWTTPELLAKRYATWFMVVDVRDLSQDVVIDNGEIVQSRWLRPAQAIMEQSSGEIRLNGPSFVTLSQLAACESIEQALQQYRDQSVDFFEPRGFKLEQGFVTLYQGDSDYVSTELPTESPENAHRLYMNKEGPWRYLKT